MYKSTAIMQHFLRERELVLTKVRTTEERLLVQTSRQMVNGLLHGPKVDRGWHPPKNATTKIEALELCGFYPKIRGWMAQGHCRRWDDWYPLKKN